ncbi:MAG: hypothetical protein JXB14_01020 [Candidatus Altiarchaeota archaeon]|nr:hypothetical protein [Candidatus Altiarchaeota archaeon]
MSKKKEAMDYKSIIEFGLNLRKDCRGILKFYFSEGCPCRYPRFSYWVSKSNGPVRYKSFKNSAEIPYKEQFWMDEVQGMLIEECLYNKHVQTSEWREGEEGFYRKVHCKVCGSDWVFMAEEWRMGAYAANLFPVRLKVKQDLGAKAPREFLCSDYVFRTAGYKPRKSMIMNREEWKRFMTEKAGKPKNDGNKRRPKRNER